MWFRELFPLSVQGGEVLDVSVLPAFLIAVVVILVTPGPDMAFLIATGVSQGRRAAVRGAFGVTSAMTIWVLVAATGLGVALTQVPAALDAIRLAGAGYLLFLAITTWRHAGAAVAEVSAAPNVFRRGFVVNLTNPKVALFSCRSSSARRGRTPSARCSCWACCCSSRAWSRTSRSAARPACSATRCSGGERCDSCSTARPAPSTARSLRCCCSRSLATERPCGETGGMDTTDALHTTTSSPLTALVTGATSGIGREVTLQLADAGWRVIAVGRDQQALEQLGAASERISPRAADLLEDDLAGLVPEQLDALVHAAGISGGDGVEQTGSEEWSRMLTLNVTAGAQLARHALPALRRSRGTIVFLNSGAGTAARPRNAVYAASKHALRALANGLRVEEESNGVRVSSVYPGPTDTPMFTGDVDRSELIRPASVAAAVLTAITASPDVQLTDIHVRPRRELSW